MSIAFPKHHFTDSGSLAGAIRERDATVAVVGMGYVGLPLAMALDRAGFDAIGFDANESKIESLAGGTSHVTDIADATLRTGAIRFTASSSARLARVTRGQSRDPSRCYTASG